MNADALKPFCIGIPIQNGIEPILKTKYSKNVILNGVKNLCLNEHYEILRWRSESQ